MKKIKESLMERWNNHTEKIAQAIRKGDWFTVAKYLGIMLVVLLCGLALILLLFTLVGKVFGPLLLKIVTIPTVLFVLYLSYKANYEDSQAAKRAKIESSALDEWADSVYEYVRDAVFLVLRAVAEYTNIVIPPRASAIELVDNPYSIEDGYVVFHFMSKVSGPLDLAQFKEDFQRTLRVMHRADELHGIPRTLVEINGSFYCPLQILGNPIDLGDSVQISMVFTTEKTVKLTHAYKLLNLDNVGRARRSRETKLTDDEL